MTESRSLRIAAELRAQIESGELAPGERVPSAREITRRWGVAVATASRALAALRDDGLVRPVPGVGTVVVPRSAPRTARPRRRVEQVLSLDRIVAAAVVIADAEGLDGLSMRRVATDLGASPMALYRHVADKDDLLLGMLDRALREARLPEVAPAGLAAEPGGGRAHALGGFPQAPLAGVGAVAHPPPGVRGRARLHRVGARGAGRGAG